MQLCCQSSRQLPSPSQHWMLKVRAAGTRSDGSLARCRPVDSLSVIAHSCVFFSPQHRSVCQPTQRTPSGAPRQTTQPQPPSQRARHLQGPPHSHTLHKPTRTQLEKMKKLRRIWSCMLHVYASAPSFTNALFLERRGFFSPKHRHSNMTAKKLDAAIVKSLRSIFCCHQYMTVFCTVRWLLASSDFFSRTTTTPNCLRVTARRW